jgi:predicted nucleotidyltransferase
MQQEFAMTVGAGSDQLAEHKRYAREREAQRLADLKARRERAWAVAGRAAELLKGSPWHATRVVLYGSVAGGDHFNERSDIDLAVEGVAPDEFFRAWAALTEIEAGFELNLAPLEAVRPALRASIDEEGVDL